MAQTEELGSGRSHLLPASSSVVLFPGTPTCDGIHRRLCSAFRKEFIANKGRLNCPMLASNPKAFWIPYESRNSNQLLYNWNCVLDSGEFQGHDSLNGKGIFR
ncbi:hypothetical protein TNCV_3517001 [Trichonephila clavipes]|nr:hypothetical protein TNCV_3517001 [Trichonephila clavipes]